MEPTPVQSSAPTPVEAPVSAPRYPWLNIWIKPLGTIREILDYNPEYFVIPLVILMGFAQWIDRITAQSAGDTMSGVGLFLAILIGGPIVGVLSLYIAGWIIAEIGKLFGGTGSSADVRAALAWSSLPNILSFGLASLLLVPFGMEAFQTATPRIDALMNGSPVVIFLFGVGTLGIVCVSFVLRIWNFVLVIKCVAEAHQCSSWRSLDTLAILMLIIFACVVTAFFGLR